MKTSTTTTTTTTTRRSSFTNNTKKKVMISIVMLCLCLISFRENQLHIGESIRIADFIISTTHIDDDDGGGGDGNVGVVAESNYMFPMRNTIAQQQLIDNAVIIEEERQLFHGDGVVDKEEERRKRRNSSSMNTNNYIDKDDKGGVEKEEENSLSDSTTARISKNHTTFDKKERNKSKSESSSKNNTPEENVTSIPNAPVDEKQETMNQDERLLLPLKSKQDVENSNNNNIPKVSININKHKSNNEQSNDNDRYLPLSHPDANILNENSTAACLYVKNENHRLIEWIPYHYHVASLRRLIIMNTRDADISPQPIVDRWKDRIEITLLQQEVDDAFFKSLLLWEQEEERKNSNNNANTNTSTTVTTDNRQKENPLELHRRGQRRFIRSCYKTIKNEGYKLAFHVDPDEFVMINYKYLIEDPNNPMYLANIPNLTIPSQEEPDSILKFMKILQPHRANNTRNTNRNIDDSPCIVFARLSYSNKETTTNNTITNFTDAEQYLNNDPILRNNIDRNRMNTFRWRYRRSNVGAVPAKGMGEVQRVTNAILSNSGVHTPIDRDTCKHMLPEEHKSIFVVHHYPSTWEQLLARKYDARAVEFAGESQQKFHENSTGNLPAYFWERYREESASVETMESSVVSTWLKGFIQQVGRDEAIRLLKGVENPNHQ